MSKTWLWFSGARMYLNDGRSVSSYPAVSGRDSAKRKDIAKFSYSAAHQKKKESGPLPEGDYIIKLSDMRVYEHTGKVKLGAALHTFDPLFGGPSPAQVLQGMEFAFGKMPGRTGRIIPILNKDGGSSYAHGRNNCWIHGSDAPGSIGCIDLTWHMDDFIRDLSACATKEALVPLKVRYGLSPEGKETREIDQRGRDISAVA